MPDTDKKKTWVSFCMSTYKRPEFLKNTLETIAQQSFPDFEVIISDNDPLKSGEAVVGAMADERFRYFWNGENYGMIKSFNKSIERASAEYIVMITDDDPVYPTMLQTLNDLFKKYPGYGMYMGGCDWFCENSDVAKLYHLKVGTNSCISSEHNLNHVQVFTPAEFLTNFFTLKIFSHFLWSTCMVKRDILIEKGGVPDYGSPFLGDYAYMSIISADSGCVIINRALGCQTIHKENFGRNQNEQIAVVVKNFPVYLEQRLSHLQEWPQIKELMFRFVGMWVVSHMSFLYVYVKNVSLKSTEKEVFKIASMKKYWIKYFLKTRFPVIHDTIVKLKKTGSK